MPSLDGLEILEYVDSYFFGFGEIGSLVPFDLLEGITHPKISTYSK